MEKRMHQPHMSILDAVPLGIIAASAADIIPSIAAVFAIAWYCILLWESDTVRGFTGREVVYDDDDDDDDDPEDMVGI